MLTRARIRNLYREAVAAHGNGVHWESGYGVPAPTGALRIAFDAGRETARRGLPGRGMTLETWGLVLAAWLGGCA